VKLLRCGNCEGGGEAAEIGYKENVITNEEVLMKSMSTEVDEHVIICDNFNKINLSTK